MLQGVRGDDRRGETRGADEVRSANKSDRELRSNETRSKETKGLNPSSPQTERTETSSSQAQVSAGSRSGDDGNRVAEDSGKTSESTNQPNNTGSDLQGQPPTPLLSPVSPQVLTQAIDQPNVHVAGEDCCSGDHVSGQKTESDGGSSRSPLIPLRANNSPTMGSDSAEGHALPDNDRNAQHDVPASEPNAQVMHNRSDSRIGQIVKPGSDMVADAGGTEVANSVGTRPVLSEQQPGSTLPQPESIVNRAAHTQLGGGLPDGKPEIPRTDSILGDGVPADRSVPAQLTRSTPSLSGDQDTGIRMRWASPQGQQSSVEGVERFSDLWDGQQSPQHDQTETKLPQATGVDRQVSSGQPAEPLMVGGAQGPVLSSPPPPTTQFLGQAQSAMPAHDPAEQSVRFMARSVVVDLAQPDLGHVNIRVAMTNDLVHTHLSADRPEVGQFLINGQDRLQSAFQANGLDMGQFRVDIDRQGAGRSFQHGPSQEQGQDWNQGSQGMKWGESPDRQDEQRTSLHGLLNLVA